MAREHETLTSLFEDIADSIRAKKQTSGSIKADNFPSEILSIPTGIDTSDATATAGDIAIGKTAYVKGSKVTGSASMAQSSYSNQIVTLTDGFPVTIGGGGIDVIPLSVNQNGTYTAPEGEVNVPNTNTATYTLSNPGTNIDMGATNNYRYLTTSGLVKPSGSETITENGTYDISEKASVVVNVASSGKVIQYNDTITKITNKTSYTTCNCSITVGEAGTYKCTYVHWAYAAGSTSTYATQLYKNGSAVGSVHSSPVYSNATGSNFVVTENSISLAKNDVIDVRARTRSGSSYYTTAGMLRIEKVS